MKIQSFRIAADGCDTFDSLNMGALYKLNYFSKFIGDCLVLQLHVCGQYTEATGQRRQVKLS